MDTNTLANIAFHVEYTAHVVWWVSASILFMLGALSGLLFACTRRL